MRPWWLSGSVAGLVVLAMTGLPLLAMLNQAGSIDMPALLSGSYAQRIIRFSLFQATLSTVLSVGLAIPLALALSHEPRFVGRSALVTLFSLSLVIPTIVAIYGIVAVFGRAGWVNQLLGVMSLETIRLYGLNGILLAHVFFNMPLATRVFLQALDGIPGQQWRLATQLGMGAWPRLRYLEWPNIAPLIASISVLIFALCFTSFAVVMTLGGGPKATTIEVAIYQALRFDFDLPLAVTLALVQLIICTALMALSSLFPNQVESSLTFTSSPIQTGWRPARRFRWLSFLTIAIAAGLVASPMIALLLAGVNPALPEVLQDRRTLGAAGNTVLVASTASVLAVLLGIALLVSTRHLRVRLGWNQLGKWLQLAGNLILVMPPLVLGTGLFLLLRSHADVFSLALVLVVAINSLMALPFVLRILDGPMMQMAREDDRLLLSLGIRGWNRWRLIDWPRLRRAIGLSAAVSATLAAGDLGAIALFGSERVSTLPLLLYQRMGSYRLDEAAVTAAFLLLLCLALFALLQRLIGGRRDHA